MDVLMVYLNVRGLKGISLDRLFTYCDLPTDLMVINSIRITVILMLGNFFCKRVSIIGTVYPETSLNHQM